MSRLTATQRRQLAAFVGLVPAARMSVLERAAGWVAYQQWRAAQPAATFR